MDSTDLHLCPDVGNGYSLSPEQIIVSSPGCENPWVALFGSLEYPCGSGVYTLHEHKTNREVRKHLEILLSTDEDCFFFVVLDNA